MTLRSSTTRIKSASSSVRLSSAVGVPASSAGSATLFPFSSKVRDWQEVTARLTADPGARAGEDQQDDGGGSSRARTGGGF